MALQYAIEEMQGDREVVMTAVARHGWALQYATEEMQGDPGQGAPTIAWSGN